MIKKMVLEDATFGDKDLTLIDVDFSKAYDSTEKFAKDISLRRMGFPQEGLDLWQMYDDTREMMVQTAYGHTDPIRPECRMWGVGARRGRVTLRVAIFWRLLRKRLRATRPWNIPALAYHCALLCISSVAGGA